MQDRVLPTNYFVVFLGLFLDSEEIQTILCCQRKLAFETLSDCLIAAFVCVIQASTEVSVFCLCPRLTMSCQERVREEYEADAN